MPWEIGSQNMKIALLNGPNLNLLGKREPDIYGKHNLQDIENKLKNILKAQNKKHDLISFQSNHEGEIIDFIHKAATDGIAYIIFNPGAYTHTSIAIRDAISGTNSKVIEIHLSNIHKREEFRHKSYIAPVAIGQICGFGIQSYEMALNYILNNKE